VTGRRHPRPRWPAGSAGRCGHRPAAAVRRLLLRRRVVVGVALYDGAGRVLVARRRGGGWEFPGGKVEPGESERAAARRECAEELGVQVRLTRRLPGEQPCGGGYRLRIWAGAVVRGEPAPHEHAELRWAGRAELATLDWLPADFPFVTTVTAGL
jgi:8-oxo-dGTP diphosphatase